MILGDDLAQDVNRLWAENADLRAEVAALRSENAMLKVTEELPNLRDRVRDQRRELTRLTAELCDAPMVRAELRASNAEVAALREENARLTPDCGSRLADYRREIAALREWQAKACRVFVLRVRLADRCVAGSEGECDICKLLTSAEGKR